jgi:hypothetical protein
LEALLFEVDDACYRIPLQGDPRRNKLAFLLALAGAQQGGRRVVPAACSARTVAKIFLGRPALHPARPPKCTTYYCAVPYGRAADAPVLPGAIVIA